MDEQQQRSFGVFKPVGHVVISFAEPAAAAAAQQELGEAGAADAGVQHFDDREMLAIVERGIAEASPLAAVGQELNLLRAMGVLAGKGYHFLLVPASDDDEARRVAEIAERHGAERAQRYGRFIIEELIERPGDLPQVAESPARGLDAQTPSGLEAEAGALKEREQQQSEQQPERRPPEASRPARADAEYEEEDVGPLHETADEHEHEDLPDESEREHGQQRQPRPGGGAAVPPGPRAAGARGGERGGDRGERGDRPGRL